MLQVTLLLGPAVTEGAAKRQVDARRPRTHQFIGTTAVRSRAHMRKSLNQGQKPQETVKKRQCDLQASSMRINLYQTIFDERERDEI